MRIAPSVCDYAIHSKYVADIENDAEPHLRAGREKLGQGLEKLGGRPHSVFQSIEPEEVEDHTGHGQFSYAIEGIEALQDLQVGHQDNGEVQHLPIEPEIEVRAITQDRETLRDITDDHEY
jgi:hypothetical protein